MVFNGEECATIVLLYTYTESVEEKNYDEEWKEMEKERKRKKKCSLLDLNSVSLGCKNHLARYSEASQVVLSGVLVSWQAAKIFNLQMRAQGCNNRGGIPGNTV